MIIDRGGKRTAFLAIVGIAALLWTAACDSGGEDGTEGSGEESAEGGGATTVPSGGQTFSLAAGFTAVTQAGTAGGNQDASELYPDNPDCLGSVASSADHVITVEGSVGVAINVTADDDTTLVITGPGGPYCNDDFEGLNPGWQGTLAAGEYQVFVGTYDADEGGVAYTLVASPWAEPVPEPVEPVVVPEGTAEGTAAAPPTPAPGP